MRILLIHQYFLEKNEGGGSRFNEMVKAWTSDGVKIDVISGMVNYATGKKPEKYKGKSFYKDTGFYDGVDVYRCHVSESYNTNFLGRLWGYFSFVFSSTIAGLFKTREKYDAIVVTSPPLFVGITAFILSIFKRVPIVFEVRDLWPESAIDTGVLKNKLIIKMAYWFENFIYKKSALINVLTPAFKTKLIEKGVSQEKILFIPNAADFTLAEQIQNSDFDADAFKKELGLEGKFVITYVGAHGVANHLIQLVDAASKLQDTPVIFQLIGSGMQKQMLQDEVKNRGLNNVIFRNAVPKNDVFKYILASDMGASVLKKVDTFKTIYSNKTFDYMSCKRPVFLAIDGVSRELIEKADCGVYVEPENIEDIETKIRLILQNREELIESGIRGYNYAKIHFDRSILAQQYINHIQSLCDKK
ncbi:glycosyltransferase WbuB [Dokdonia pacifica]|uniref:Glycosyltransferase involved in cell wall bisynthesis n=1 Tax=Dokdonia pacifica TaxID=1627892 RepID=A0A238YMR6_9FLAO|nr:glycosyltransferase family 4 protein [Dokdonia pacifica]GGG11454.1 glycosyltransferase WbuB [Dokdonia pacifica]SNR71903.1 Glycosyltransferase involved in cell wall bisynthesis [Dokdonia pacifica]